MNCLSSFPCSYQRFLFTLQTAMGESTSTVKIPLLPEALTSRDKHQGIHLQETVVIEWTKLVRALIKVKTFHTDMCLLAMPHVTLICPTFSARHCRPRKAPPGCASRMRSPHAAPAWPYSPPPWSSLLQTPLRSCLQTWRLLIARTLMKSCCVGEEGGVAQD